MEEKGYIVLNDVTDMQVTKIYTKKRDAFKEWAKSVTLETYLNEMHNYSIVKVEADDICIEPLEDGIKIADYLANVFNGKDD